ncbi:mechanosensitive ion channel [Sphingomonas sinipercae]|uniref:Small-conductance mechanosensitive channel n=1 Tax=Sphingomonas sinipercae TaxID=2714944 RepID=A0A6G7ZLU8_9SPHN|nr:mechanosensitive ion channel [Sphingomonas sinipercae]QIL01954.1 mechanosensitive ion channel [Sphingomonas sinipercae]
MYDQTGDYWQNQAMEWGPRILIAILILIATWLVARAVKWALAKAISRTPALQRNTPGNQHETVGHQIGTIAKLIIWLVGIMAALQFLGIAQILQPINQLLAGIFEFLPRLLGFGLILFIGYILARILRQLTESVVSAMNVDGLLNRLGIRGARSESSVSPMPAAGPQTGVGAASRPAAGLARALGMLAFALVIIPAAIAAFEVLGIEAISLPAINMLNEIFTAIPRILTAGLWIGIAYILARFVKSIIEAVLPPTGFDQAIRSTGIVPTTATPSTIVANVAMVAIVLVASIEAAKQLGGGTIAIFLAQVTELGGKVIFGTLIIVAGIFLARIIAGLVGSSTGEGGFGQTIVRYAIIALFTAIGLTFMGLADVIVMMAFGLILGSAAVAAALAFGLGGRDAAARLLNQAADKAETQLNTPTPPTPPTPRPVQQSSPSDDRQPPLV